MLVKYELEFSKFSYDLSLQLKVHSTASSSVQLLSKLLEPSDQTELEVSDAVIAALKLRTAVFICARCRK